MATEPVAKEEQKKPKSFEALTPELSSWILDYTHAMNFARTTPVQAMAVPLLMGNKDLVVEAVTGSGKTLSFLIPLVERLLRADEPNKKGHVRALIVAPTKELATQIHGVLLSLLAFHSASNARLAPPKLDADGDEAMDVEPPPPGPYVAPQLLIGGRTKLTEDLSAFAARSPNVLIGTPKRMAEVLGSSRVVLKRHWFDLLVLDEADRLLDANFQPDLQRILELVPKERRTGLFSASVSEALDELVRVGMRYPFKISAKVRGRTGALDKKTPEALRLWYAVTKPTEKVPVLKRVLEHHSVEKGIIYVSTRAGVDYWAALLPPLLNVAVFPLHGDHKAAIRTKNLTRFRDCTTPALLLTTDVLARGIDIPDIDMVVQLDPPAQPKDFIHRCGRSGRAGKRGMALTFVHAGSEEDYIKYLDLQGTKVEPYPTAPADLLEDAEAAAEQTTSAIRAQLTRKRELHDRSQRAFVSWVQAYTKAVPQDIFAPTKIDWAEVGRAWGLLRWPKMPELKRHFPVAVKDRTCGLAVTEGLDLDEVAYLDEKKEAKRVEVLEARRRGERVEGIAVGGRRLAEARRRKERAWSGQKEAKDLREARRERKVVRRGKEREGKMSEGERAEAAGLEEMIRKVREKNERESAEEDWEGFAD